MTILQVSRLRKRYPASGPESEAVDAVRGVSFRLGAGELLGLVGESGCGKTTLLKLIAGLEEPDAGRIRLNGRVVNGPAYHLVPGHPDIRLAFQDSRLSPNLTVAQNLVQALKGYQKAYQAQRLTEVLRVCQLERRRNHYPRQLSGGEQQRVALARALADEPAVLLLDEPFSNLDEPTKQPLRQALLTARRVLGTTALLVTHDGREALALSDRIAVMRAGKLVQLDAPRTAYRKPVSPYAALLFGPANILSADQLRRLLPGEGDQPACIRAEDIRVCPAGEDQFSGKVRQVTYFGAYDALEVRVEDAISLTLHVPVATARVGDVLPLRVHPGNVHRFP
ncbi:MAG: ABC transporter ATP-binding protein [Ferruginibacter sp.]|nr:ABC transporter ATP-binding protein [Cytophagales bacterium]